MNNVYCSDLCSAFGAQLIKFVDTEPVSEMLAIGRRSKTGKTRMLSVWASKEIRRLKAASSSSWSVSQGHFKQHTSVVSFS